MAYIKYKELTKYFNFKKEIDLDTLPNYVNDYILENERVIRAYKTNKDKGIFTDQRMILFDIQKFGLEKTIHVIPYNSISSIAIAYQKFGASIMFSMNSGYQLKLKFVNMKPENKKNLRKLYVEIITKGMMK